jgi:hypothetical protein
MILSVHVNPPAAGGASLKTMPHDESLLPPFTVAP